MSPIIAIAPWRAPVEMFYEVLLCIAICINSIGYAFSFVFADPDNAVLTGTIMVILLNLFGGFVPKLGEGLMGDISYTHYSARAIAAVELYHGWNITTGFNKLVPNEWKNPDVPKDCGVLLEIAVVVYLISYLLFEYQFLNLRRNHN